MLSVAVLLSIGMVSVVTMQWPEIQRYMKMRRM
jgi:hypothetical protein